MTYVDGATSGGLIRIATEAEWPLRPTPNPLETTADVSDPVKVTALAVSLPDLVMNNFVTTNGTTFSAGATVQISGAVGNVGAATAGAFATRIFLSTDTTFGGSDPFFLTYTTSSLTTTQLANFSGSLTLPSNLAPGTYYLGAWADYAGQVTESNENNNARSAIITIQAAAVPTPSISSVSPTSYTADSLLHTMQVFGTSFQSGDSLTFLDPQGTVYNSDSAKLTFRNSGEIDYSFNDGADAGTWSVRVNSPDGSKHSSYLTFTVTPSVPTPLISGVTPASYVADGLNHPMQVLGSNFQSGDTLTFVDPQGTVYSSVPSKLTFKSSGEIDYSFNDGSDAGTWTVRVNSPDGSQHSSAYSFTVSPSVPTPLISGVTPSSYVADAVNHPMQVLGSNFQSGDTLTFVDPQGTVYNSDPTKLAFKSSGEIDYSFNDGSDAGTWTVRVNSPDGSQHSSAYSFTVSPSVPTPLISGVTPSSYVADAVNHPMQVLGSNFQSGDTLTLVDPQGTVYNSDPNKLAFKSSGEIDYSFNDGGDAGTWTVRVNSPDGSQHSSAYSFAVTSTATTVAISSVTPASFPADAANHLMKITGSGFVSTDTLTFIPPEGGTITSNPAKVHYISSTEIDYDFNDGADPGNWAVRVNSPATNGHSSYASFAVAESPLGAPVISSFAPISFPADSINHTLKIFGSGFVTGDSLTFLPPEGGMINSNSAKVHFISSSEIDYDFNDGNDPGQWSVRINNVDNSQHSAYNSFMVSGSGSSQVNLYVPYADPTPSALTGSDIASAAMNYAGSLWIWDDCTALVWAISVAAGAPFWESITQATGLVSAGQLRTVPDQNYVVPNTARGIGSSPAWQNPIATSNWSAFVQIGDLVRIPKGSVTDLPEGHSFVVVGKDPLTGEWIVIDNTDPSHVSGDYSPVRVRAHTFGPENHNGLYAEIMAAKLAYVSRLVDGAKPDITTSVSSGSSQQETLVGSSNLLQFNVMTDAPANVAGTTPATLSEWKINGQDSIGSIIDAATH